MGLSDLSSHLILVVITCPILTRFRCVRRLREGKWLSQSHTASRQQIYDSYLHSLALRLTVLTTMEFIIQEGQLFQTKSVQRANLKGTGFGGTLEKHFLLIQALHHKHLTQWSTLCPGGAHSWGLMLVHQDGGKRPSRISGSSRVVDELLGPFWFKFPLNIISSLEDIYCQFIPIWLLFYFPCNS